MRRQRRQRHDESLNALIAKGSAKKLKAVQQKPIAKRWITSIQDKQGNVKTDKLEILEVFALFYEQLYYPHQTTKQETPAPSNIMFNVSAGEVREHLEDVLAKMKPGKKLRTRRSCCRNAENRMRRPT